MVDFVESPRFPEDISEGSQGGPNFKTYIFEGSDGSEQATIAWAKARATYDVGYGIRDKEDMDVVRAFFYNMRGRAIGFRYKDWADYQLTDEVIGTGDGVENTFLVTKTYTAGNPYVRRIMKLVSGTAVVKVNGVTIPQGSGDLFVTVNNNTGTLTFGALVIPAAAQPVTISCEFDVPVRFDTDQLASAFEGHQSETWDSIPLVEKKIREV